jgi:hypothetical protein
LLLEDIELAKFLTFFFVFIMEILMKFSDVGITYVEMLQRSYHIIEVLWGDFLFILQPKMHLWSERWHEMPLWNWHTGLVAKCLVGLFADGIFKRLRPVIILRTYLKWGVKVQDILPVLLCFHNHR